MSPASENNLERAVDAFWEAIPSFWHRVRAHIRQVAVEQFDITVEQFHILRHIRKGQGLVSEIAEAKHISRPAISQAVEVLVNKGLITRTPRSRDRRQVQLDLTPQGDALLNAIYSNTSQWIMQLFAPLGDEELQAICQAAEAFKKIQIP